MRSHLHMHPPREALRYCRVALGLALSSIVALGCAPSSSTARTNVLLITLDTTRADHLGSYGYPLPTTPRIDRLAAQGTRFSRCIATSALTPVSHASILSGLDPHRHGLRVLQAASGDRLPASVPTLASVLAREGWSTAAVLSAFPVSEHFALDRGFAHFDSGMDASLEQPSDEPVRNLDQPRSARQRRSDATTDAAIEWLRAERRPFLLWVHYWDPHDPILVPPRAATESFREQVVRSSGRPPSIYDAEIAFMDAQIGRLLDELARQGLDASTLVVLTADHGQGHGEHDWHSHRLLYQEQIHVPLILRLPGQDAGGVVDELVRTTDIFPSVLGVVGVEPPLPVDGESLLGLLQRGEGGERLAYAEALIKWDQRARALRETRPQDDDLLHCLTDGRLKLIYRPLNPQRSELYDLASDPGERHNLYATGHPAEQALRQELLRREAFALEPLGESDIDPEAARALRALGYSGDDG